ncbi:SRPBCC family protein [Amycolatopsis sp. cmx-4-68]|uniref:SRPBCC family protein n=1 Tax=Amycolatopsis sp. cmx-4-68 TaxID=2790938 RepID=UPI0039785AE9
MTTEIDLSAPVVVRRETVINAPLHRVWQLHTDVTSWPQWQPDITATQADCPLTTDSTFRWSTGGLDIESTVYEVEEPRRIVWGGPAHGITEIHLWTFDVTGSAVRVRTEESWDGDPVRADIPFMRAALDQSLAAWLNHLKKAAENAS